jgi:hypothetical protein
MDVSERNEKYYSHSISDVVQQDSIVVSKIHVSQLQQQELLETSCKYQQLQKYEGKNNM